MPLSKDQIGVWFKDLVAGGKGPSLDDLKSVRLTYADVLQMDEPQRVAVRYLCCTSLRFLVNCILRPASPKFLSLNESTHGRIFDSFLVAKPGAAYDLWSETKERVTLAFRGALKSTIVAGFITQMVLCDENIRILVLSGKLPHAKTIMATARRPFFANDVIRELFPDWAIKLDETTGDSFECPHRNKELNLRDPTISIATFDSVKAGGHFELLVFDDCTNEINCATPDLVEKNEQHWDDTYELIEPGGYRHFFGTRWAPDDTDLPEVIRRRGIEYFEENGENNTEYTFVPVWVLNDPDDPDVIARDHKNQLKPTDVTLIWPEKIKAKFLWPKYRANPEKFNKQYLLRYRTSLTAESFTKDLLLANTRPFAEVMPLPHDRFMAIIWDLGGVYSGRRTKDSSDFSCGMAGMFELSTKRLVIYDAILEVFVSSTDMATAIVQFYQRQLKIARVGICSIEDAFGARNLEGEINGIAKQLNVPIQINWEVPDNTANSKNVAIGLACGAMKKGLINFSTTIPYRDIIFSQFEKWIPRPGKRKDDAPDCVAKIWKYSGSIFPNTVAAMQPSGSEYSFEPEVPAEVDPHAGEKENADFALLRSMTVPHAG
jgi:hypothetical protein